MHLLKDLLAYLEGNNEGDGKWKGKLDTKLSRFVLNYLTTPLLTTAKTPNELLMNRKLKTFLDVINPLSKNTAHSYAERKHLAQ